MIQYNTLKVNQTLKERSIFAADDFGCCINTVDILRIKGNTITININECRGKGEDYLSVMVDLKNIHQTKDNGT